MTDQLINILADVFSLRKDQITSDLTQDDVGSWDSLKQMDLVMSIEQTYEIQLDIPDIIKMNSVATIIEILKDKGVDLGA